jgi:hypothetical protein
VKPLAKVVLMQLHVFLVIQVNFLIAAFNAWIHAHPDIMEILLRIHANIVKIAARLVLLALLMTALPALQVN